VCAPYRPLRALLQSEHHVHFCSRCAMHKPFVHNAHVAKKIWLINARNVRRECTPCAGCVTQRPFLFVFFDTCIVHRATYFQGVSFKIIKCMADPQSVEAGLHHWAFQFLGPIIIIFEFCSPPCKNCSRSAAMAKIPLR